MRIRSVKPEFWSSQSNGRVSRSARLVFIGLWSLADNFGRFRADPRVIAGALLPYDRDGLAVVKKALAELESEAKVAFYMVERSVFGEVLGFAAHQWMKRRGSPVHPDPRSPEAFSISARSLSGSDPETVRQGQGSGVRGQGSGIRDQGGSANVTDPRPVKQKPEKAPVEINEHLELYAIFQRRRRERIAELGDDPINEDLNPGRICATVAKWPKWFLAHDPKAVEDPDRLTDLLFALIEAYLADDWGAGAKPVKYPFAAFAKDDYWQRLAARAIEETPEYAPVPRP